MLRSSILNDIVSSNVQLKKTIDEQIKISEQQNKIIKEQAHKLDGKTKLMEQKCDNLSAELNKVKVAVSDLEQYGRRNSLRFSKLGFDPKLPENELIKKTTAFINDRMQPNSPLLSQSDIDRCHPTGQLRNNVPSHVIVKFASYHIKHRVFSAKANLRNTPVFFSEDLTLSNYAIIKKLQPLKKRNKVHSFWTSNGRIFVEKSEESRPIRLDQADDVEHRLQI